MNKRQALEAARKRCAERNLARSTEDTYAHWIGNYCDWKRSRPAADGLQEWLSYLASERRVAVKTQKQALNALVFFYRHVLDQEIGDLEFKPARQSRKVPDFLTHPECCQLFGQMRGLMMSGVFQGFVFVL